MDTGWIKLHRQIQEHWLWRERRRFSKAEAWIDLLLSASHTPNKVPLGSKLMTIERGQILTSQVALAKRWSWNRKSVVSFLSVLKSDEILDFESSKEADTGYTLITIQNYSKYQDRKNGALDIETDIETDIQGTSGGHRADTLKNVKKVKKKNIRSFSPGSTDDNGVEESFQIFYEVYPKRKSRGQAWKAWKKIEPGPELLKAMLDAIKCAKKTEEWQKEKGKYIPYPATWLNASGWEDEIEAQGVDPWEKYAE